MPTPEISPPGSNAPLTAPFPERKGYLPALDGIRGIAIIMVLLYHCFKFLPFFGFGWAGVDVFFVLSGFLITTTFLRYVDQPHPILNFYTRRALRIFPLYYLSLAIILFVLPLWMELPGLSFYRTHQAWFWLFLDNWLYNYQAGPRCIEGCYLLHFWSLAVEEQYYLFWPWLLLFIRKAPSLLLFLGMILGVQFVARYLLWMNEDHFPIYFIFTCTRIDGLCVGSALAIATHFKMPRLRRNLHQALIGTAAFCLLVLLARRYYFPTLPFLGFGGYLLISLAAATLIYWATKWDHFFLLTSPLLIRIGKISYGLYIIHWPLFALLSPHLEKFLPEFISSPICALLAILLAFCSYYGFEIHFLKLKKKAYLFLLAIAGTR